MSYRPRGTVYGVLLNAIAEYDALAPAMHEPPYRAPPRAPVLYVKTANTFNPHGGTVTVPVGVEALELGATIGMVMGADGGVEGFVPMIDWSIPHESFYRPPVRAKCVDGFLGLAPSMRDAQDAPDPSAFRLEVRVDGRLAQTIDFSRMRRDARTLLADVGEFMTLAHGDVLMLGCEAGRPLVRAGQRVEVDGPGFETLVQTLVAEAA